MKGKLLTFFLGLVLGVSGTIFLPRLLGSLLPAGLRGGESVEGTVVRRQRDGERLLLTINTGQGAALATFTDNVAEIDLLVEEGDAVTLGLGAYEPFVENPPIRAVRKAEAAPDLAPEPDDPRPSQAEESPDKPSAEQAPEAEAELEQWPGTDEDG